jgi:aspartate/methionine/tyrosine aminotransferase
MFSRRLPPHADLNALTAALARRAGRGPVIDLTESNPTRARIPYPRDLLRGLSAPGALHYEPHALGLPSAREAIARDHGRRRITIDPAHVVLTASTSEAYTWLFKLLCNPGESVLVPRPSYPLFEHLTRLEGVCSTPFDLEYHGRWEIDPATLDAAPPSTRAVVVVSPNNPTGSYVSKRDIQHVSGLCRDRGWALIVDEVFADYPLEVDAPLTDIAARSDVLAFTLSGLSKSAGLPQLKLGWIVVGGPPVARDAALAGLELIADSFLSVATPVQLAAADLIEHGASVRSAIRERIGANLAALRDGARSFTACEVLKTEGGWSAVIRVPATRSEEQFVLDLLEQEGILAHPGYFYDFQRDTFVVISLLSEPDVFRDASTRLLGFASS